MVANLSIINIPSAVVVGAGASLEVAAHAKRFGARRVLLVTDKFLAGNGVAERIVHCLQSSGIAVVVFSDVQPDPTVQNVNDGLRMFGESGAEAIVALGGGSPIDAGKAISILATNPRRLTSIWAITKFPVRECRWSRFRRLPVRAARLRK